MKKYEYDYKFPILYETRAQQREAFDMGVKDHMIGCKYPTVGVAKGGTHQYNTDTYKKCVDKAIPWPKVKAQLLGEDKSKPQLVYGDMKDARKGDIVECVTSSPQEGFKKGDLYIIKSRARDTIITEVDSCGSTTNGWGAPNFCLVKTKPGADAKPGDTVICTSAGFSAMIQVGTVYTAQPRTDRAWVFWEEGSDKCLGTGHFKVLCTESVDLFPKGEEYYKYFQKLRDTGVALEVKYPSRDWMPDTPSNNRPVYNYEEEINATYRLANPPAACPDPNTKEYFEYWQERYDAGENVCCYNDTSVEAYALHDERHDGPYTQPEQLGREIPHRVFFIAKPQIDELADITTAKTGDIVEFIGGIRLPKQDPKWTKGNWTIGNRYELIRDYSTGIYQKFEGSDITGSIRTVDDQGIKNGWAAALFKLVERKPIADIATTWPVDSMDIATAKAGDTVECLTTQENTRRVEGKQFVIRKIEGSIIYYMDGFGAPRDNFKLVQRKVAKNPCNETPVPSMGTWPNVDYYQHLYEQGIPIEIIRPRGPVLCKDLGPKDWHNGPHEFRVQSGAYDIASEGIVIKRRDGLWAQPQQQKENTMKKDDVTIEFTAKVNGEEIDLSGTKAARKCVVKTDLEAAPATLAIWYNPQGDEIEVTRYKFSSKKKVSGIKSALQIPTNLGNTVRIYAFTKSYTTNIPVVEVKA